MFIPLQFLSLKIVNPSHCLDVAHAQWGRESRSLSPNWAEDSEMMNWQVLRDRDFRTCDSFLKSVKSRKKWVKIFVSSSTWQVQMKKGAFPLLLVMIGMTIVFIPRPQVLRAASLSQSECPSCASFGIQRPSERKGAPAFSLKGLDGKQVSLSDFKGKPVFIVFWATW